VAVSLNELVPFLTTKLNELMFDLYLTRELLLDIEQSARTGVCPRDRVVEALAALRQQEKTLTEIQARLNAAQRL
jgi:hypothetical protein